MATPVISRPAAVDSSPLLTIGDEKPDRGGDLGQATKLSTALGEATADQQDTSDSDDQDLDGEKNLEVQADKNDSDDEALQGEKSHPQSTGRSGKANGRSARRRHRRERPRRNRNVGEAAPDPDRSSCLFTRNVFVISACYSRRRLLPTGTFSKRCLNIDVGVYLVKSV